MSKLFRSAFLAAVLFISCTGNEYSEFENLLKKKNSTEQTFIKKIDKADTAEKVEKAINDFNESINEIHTEITAYTSVNPEFEKIIKRITEPPRELAAEIRESDELSSAYFDALRKISKFVTDSGVKDALGKMEDFLDDIDNR